MKINNHKKCINFISVHFDLYIEVFMDFGLSKYQIFSKNIIKTLETIFLANNYVILVSMLLLFYLHYDLQQVN